MVEDYVTAGRPRPTVGGEREAAAAGGTAAGRPHHLTAAVQQHAIATRSNAQPHLKDSPCINIFIYLFCCSEGETGH